LPFPTNRGTRRRLSRFAVEKEKGVAMNAQRFRAKAEEARVLAEEMVDHEARLMMLDLAEGYDRLAHFYERSVRHFGSTHDFGPTRLDGKSR